MKIEKEYEIVEDIHFFLEAEKTDLESFSRDANISKTILYKILKEKKTTKLNYERIYSHIYKQGYRLNNVKEELLKETCKNVFYHGSKFGLEKIEIDGSRNTCDFGKGFYLGETYSNAACFVCENNDSSIYSFTLNTKDLNILEFECTLDWMLAICYYRNSLNEYKEAKKIKEIIKKIENSDLIIAPIADNRMFYIMSLFTNGDINSEVAIHSLSASFMGKQYILKSEKAIANLKPIEKYYLCKEEKDDFIDFLNRRTDEIETKLKMAKRNFKEGLYIEEILK